MSKKEMIGNVDCIAFVETDGDTCLICTLASGGEKRLEYATKSDRNRSLNRFKKMFKKSVDVNGSK